MSSYRHALKDALQGFACAAAIWGAFALLSGYVEESREAGAYRGKGLAALETAK